MNDYQKNVIRTAVPSVVGLLISLLAQAGLDLSSASLAYLVPVATTIYYALIRYAEKRWPNLSWLLGAFPVDPFKTEVAKKS
jgi:hypothetical protein